ncbi:hypothetical protein CHS0354_031571, partial [Potamilus streckersoni]
YESLNVKLMVYPSPNSSDFDPIIYCITLEDGAFMKKQTDFKKKTVIGRTDSIDQYRRSLHRHLLFYSMRTFYSHKISTVLINKKDSLDDERYSIDGIRTLVHGHHRAI